MFPEYAQPLLIKARVRRGSDLCVEQTCRSMDAVSQGMLLANSSHMLLYSVIVWLLYFFPKELSRWMGALPGCTHEHAEPYKIHAVPRVKALTGLGKARGAESWEGPALLAASVGREMGAEERLAGRPVVYS